MIFVTSLGVEIRTARILQAIFMRMLAAVTNHENVQWKLEATLTIMSCVLIIYQSFVFIFSVCFDDILIICFHI